MNGGPPEHTPGPWTTHKDGMGMVWVAGGVSPDPVTEARYLDVAIVLRTASPDPFWRQVEERDANAQLIAAAPELLEVLGRVMAHCSDGQLPVMLERQARAVLAKALDRSTLVGKVTE